MEGVALDMETCVRCHTGGQKGINENDNENERSARRDASRLKIENSGSPSARNRANIEQNQARYFDEESKYAEMLSKFRSQKQKI